MHIAIPVKAGSRFIAEQSGNTVIIRLKPGGLDSRLPARDRREVADLLTRHRGVIVDLAEVATTTAAGLEIIVGWIEHTQAAGNDLVLARCSRPTLSLLSVLRISRAVPVFSNLGDAVDSFEAGRKTMSRHAG
jgi:ABC-type transporter Mla MlaB component